MIKILSKIFIKNNNDFSNQKVRQKYGELCGTVGIILNIILFIIKFIAGILTGSIAVTADAFNNLSDSGSSLISIIGFRLSGKKPDKDHPFGHGRFEYISGLIVSMLILLMGFELAKSSVENIIHPQEIQFNLISVIILSVSVIVKLYMAFYNKIYGKKIDSPALLSTSADSFSDCAATCTVLAAILIFKFSGINIDAYFGLLVSLFIIFAGFNAAKDTIGPLLGQPPTKEFVEEISSIVLSHELIHGIHDLVVHDYGPGRIMISLHAEVPSDTDINIAHDDIDNIEVELSEKLGCEAVIHMDPISVNDDFTKEIREIISKKAKEIDEEITIHDLRIVIGDTHTNLIFDAVVPQNYIYSDDEVKKMISEKISAINNNYFCVIKIDKSYV